MLWSVLLAGLCGGLAGLVARLVVRDVKNSRGRYAVVLAATFVLFNSASRALVLPHIRAWQARSEARQYLAHDPLWSLLAKQHPEVGDQFTEMMVGLARKGASAKEAKAQGFALGRSMLPSYFAKYAGRASSASLVEYVSVMVAVLQELQKKSPEACYYFLFGQGTEGGSTLADLSPEHQERMTTSLTHVLESALRDPAAAPDQSEGNRLMMGLIQRLA